MTQEEIKKAADEFADREYEISDIDRDALHKGFFHGAEWRINSVWHKPDESPNGVFVIIMQLDSDVEEYSFGVKELYDGTIRWAYVSDLLPRSAKNFQQPTEFSRKNGENPQKNFSEDGQTKE